MKILLVDFGATNIKSVVYDTDSAAVIDFESVASPSQTNHDTAPAFTVPVNLYRQALDITAGKLLAMHNDVDSIYICSEMHGFTMDNQYISWKDSRADLKKIDKLAFYNETGLITRPGIAYATLKTLEPKNKRIGTLVDAVLDSSIGNDITLTASQGFVNKYTQLLSTKIINEFEGLSVVPLAQGCIGTYRNKMVYGGLGDLQAAILGAGLGITADMVINLGTGSQVAVLTDSLDQGDLRPYVNGTWVRVLSHIPSGRALNVVAELVEPSRFWSIWQNLNAEEILTSDHQQVDLNLFASAWQYTNCSGFIRLQESQTVQHFVAAVAAAWVRQYVIAMHRLDCKTNQTRVAVSGGLAHKSPFLIDCLTTLSPGRTYFQPKLATGEETLDGLIKIHADKK